MRHLIKRVASVV